MKNVNDIIKDLEARQSSVKEADLQVSYKKEVVPIIQELHLVQAKLEVYEKTIAEAEVHAQRFVFLVSTLSKMRETSSE